MPTQEHSNTPPAYPDDGNPLNRAAHVISSPGSNPSTPPSSSPGNSHRGSSGSAGLGAVPGSPAPTPEALHGSSVLLPTNDGRAPPPAAALVTRPVQLRLTAPVVFFTGLACASGYIQAAMSSGVRPGKSWGDRSRPTSDPSSPNSDPRCSQPAEI